MGINDEIRKKSLCKYIEFCPSCAKTITDDEIRSYRKCLQCYQRNKESQFLQLFSQLQNEIKNFTSFAFEKFNIDLTAIQINWAKKFFLNQSYAVIFPPGTGKTTFGVVLATYLWLHHKKHSYIVLPSQQLLEQIVNKLYSIFPDINLLAVSKVSKKKSDFLKERIKKSDFSILITTSMFLNKNYILIPQKFFELYFIDDGDLFFKNAKNVNYLLNLMGFSEDDVNKTLRLIKLKREWSKFNTEDYIKQKEELAVTTKYKGSVVVSSASGIPQSSKIGLLYNLLGFELGKPNIAIRKVIDACIKLNPTTENVPNSKIKTNTVISNSDGFINLLLENTKYWIETLGKGGIIFVSSIYGKNFIEKLQKYLQNHKINADTYDKRYAVQNFISGKVDCLLGIASYNNPLTRGIDLPFNIYYSIFVGIPKFVFTLRMEDIDKSLSIVLSLLRSVFIKTIGYDSSRYDRLLKYMRKGGKKLPDNLQEIYTDILLLLRKGENIKKINESPEAALTIEDNIIKIAVSDITGYLQASGRTSRLSKIGITQGLSLILSDDEKALNHLTRKIRFYIDDFNIKEYNKETLLEFMRQIQKERNLLQSGGAEQITFKDSKLIIVESPHKARTIASFFGRPSRRRVGPVEVYETLDETSYICIAATKGHIADLGHNKFYGVEKDNNNFLPLYVPLRRCPKCNKTMTLEVCRKDQVQTLKIGLNIISALRKLAQETDHIYIATDPDAEGEKIAFDLFSALYPLNQNIERIEFHEVTKKALFAAITNPRNINILAVKSQFLRRISDRWIGFSISKKLQNEFLNLNLSAGRVQTPILGWIIKRYQDYIKNRIYCIGITFANFIKPLSIVFKFKDNKQAREIFENVNSIRIEKQKEQEKEIFPPPPFTTDALLQSAIKVLRKGAQDIMRIAQELYEFGFITYHRTDSLYISQTGINIAQEYIKSINKEHLFKYRNYPQGTHEAIRPTKPLDAEELKSDLYLGLQDLPLSKEHILVYDLIFRRFIASLMEQVKVKEVIYTATIGNAQTTFSVYEEILQEGFNTVSPINIYNFEKVEYQISEDNKIYKSFWTASETDLYTQATLIEEMKKNGLGRPSTYASIIQKLFERGYVFEMRNKIIPLKNGKTVYEYLTNTEKYKSAKYIKSFVTQEYTAQLEKNIDEIEKGHDVYNELLLQLYKDINKIEHAK